MAPIKGQRADEPEGMAGGPDQCGASHGGQRE